MAVYKSAAIKLANKRDEIGYDLLAAPAPGEVSKGLIQCRLIEGARHQEPFLPLFPFNSHIPSRDDDESLHLSSELPKSTYIEGS
jgi:hypothetical protein